MNLLDRADALLRDIEDMFQNDVTREEIAIRIMALTRKYSSAVMLSALVKVTSELRAVRQ